MVKMCISCYYEKYVTEYRDFSEINGVNIDGLERIELRDVDIDGIFANLPHANTFINCYYGDMAKFVLYGLLSYSVGR